ncbi:MAG: hypothetical protein NC177_02375 [Ruminococcus flavefaciens]|nr:hypothetical protein [Ruminococcus flavefaciens]
MTELETIEKDVSLFHTPYCDFSFTDSENKKIRFDIMEALQKEIYLDEEVIKSYCDGRTMRIYTENLELKKNYYIRPSVGLEFSSSDERLFTFGIIGNDYTFSVSFPEPNEDIKFRNYTEDDLKEYDIEPSDGVFILRLYDRSKEYIDIFTFWIWNIHGDIDIYQSACDVATWWCP